MQPQHARIGSTHLGRMAAPVDTHTPRRARRSVEKLIEAFGPPQRHVDDRGNVHCRKCGAVYGTCEHR